MNNSNEIQIKSVLPTEKYLKKFVSSMVNINPEYVLSKKDRFGNFIFDYFGERNPIPELVKEKFNDKIVITIPRFYENTGIIDFKSSSIERINSTLQDWFYHSMYDYVNLTTTFGLRIDKSIESFCKTKNIEIDIDIQYETLRKRYQRYREEFGNPMSKYIIEIVKLKQ